MTSSVESDITAPSVCVVFLLFVSWPGRAWNHVNACESPLCLRNNSVPFFLLMPRQYKTNGGKQTLLSAYAEDMQGAGLFWFTRCAKLQRLAEKSYRVSPFNVYRN